MDLEECDRCGEVYPVVWDSCPYCDSNPRAPLKMRDDD